MHKKSREYRDLRKVCRPKERNGGRTVIIAFHITFQRRMIEILESKTSMFLEECSCQIDRRDAYFIIPRSCYGQTWQPVVASSVDLCPA
jgi:hypothetical protein